jgi:CheY-like chemotaxis protein
MGDEHTRAVALLIVDDDPRILELAEHAARQTGMFSSVMTAENGRLALAQIMVAEQMPDVILTDLSMPQMDGFEFVQGLKQLNATKHIPVVMFSSSGIHYDQQHALDAGCAEFFQKPSTLSGLAELLRDVARVATRVEAR